MLTDITIENYRCFQSYRMEGLARVNLLVGKNNCGKTSLLECVRLLVSGGDVEVVLEAARMRGETIETDKGTPREVISHLFHGHQPHLGSSIRLSNGDRFSPVSLSVVTLEEEGLVGNLPSLLTNGEGPAVFALQVKGRLSDTGHKSPSGLIWRDGSIVIRYWETVFLSKVAGTAANEVQNSNEKRYVFLGSKSECSASLGQMWNHVLHFKNEPNVYSAMRILEPRIEDLAFKVGDRSSRLHSAGILAGFVGPSPRVPLGSMGEGMLRMLSLALALSYARGGSLFIDEIDTGFHYSVMPKLWEMVVRTAQETGTQVFATTHSADCVRGLGILCDRHPELQAEVAAHKIDNTLQQSIAFPGSEVRIAAQEDIEIR